MNRTMFITAWVVAALAAAAMLFWMGQFLFYLGAFKSLSFRADEVMEDGRRRGRVILQNVEEIPEPVRSLIRTNILSHDKMVQQFYDDSGLSGGVPSLETEQGEPTTNEWELHKTPR